MKDSHFSLIGWDGFLFLFYIIDEKFLSDLLVGCYRTIVCLF